MANLHKRSNGEHSEYVLDDRVIKNGDELLLRLRGNAGWHNVTISGLPAALRVQLEADDGKQLDTTLPFDAEIRWPR